MAWWQITLIIISFIIVGFVIGSIISQLILGHMQKRTAALKPVRMHKLTQSHGLGKGIWDRIIEATLLIIIMTALGTLGYILTKSNNGEKFTEFYILGLRGKAMDYPEELKAGYEGRVIVGIINHEGKDTSYRVQVLINDNPNTDEYTVTLSNDQKWESVVRFVPEVVGENQRVDFFLYKDGELEPYLEPLYLWIDVKER